MEKNNRASSANVAMNDPALAIEGEMTIYRAVELKEIIAGYVHLADSVRLDLSAVAEIDTSGLQLLLFARKEAQRYRKQFCIIASSEKALSIMNFCNIREALGYQQAKTQAIGH